MGTLSLPPGFLANQKMLVNLIFNILLCQIFGLHLPAEVMASLARATICTDPCPFTNMLYCTTPEINPPP